MEKGDRREIVTLGDGGEWEKVVKPSLTIETKDALG
jgi:hypothetical protein